MFEMTLQFFLRIIVGFLINTVCYYVGWFIFKILTLGRYPYNYPHEDGLVMDYICMSIEALRRNLRREEIFEDTHFKAREQMIRRLF